MEICVLLILIPLTILNILLDINFIVLIIHAVLLTCAIGLSIFFSIRNSVPGAGIFYYFVYFGWIEILYSLIGSILLYKGLDNKINFLILLIQIMDFILKLIIQKRNAGKIY